MTEISSWIPLVNIMIVPIAFWIVKIEKKLTRIETILEIKFHKKEDRRKC